MEEGIAARRCLRVVCWNNQGYNEGLAVVYGKGKYQGKIGFMDNYSTPRQKVMQPV